jgi:hypothetical protein
MNDNLHRKIFTYTKTFVKCGQPEGSLRYIQDIAKLKKDDLSIEEINILFGSIHTLVKRTKKQWETICAIESNEIKKNSKYKKIACDAREYVYKEMYDYIIIGLGVIDHHLLKSVGTPELEALYLMHKADLQRILISITNVDYDRDIADLKDKIEKSYKRAVEICQEIDDLSSIKAGIILHYCIYVFEDNKDVSTAYNKANELYQNANRLLNKVKNKDIHKELINLLIVLKQNIDIWSNKLASNETVDNVNIQSQDIK